MKVEMRLNNKNNTYSATGIYDSGSVIVKAGTRIFPNFASCIRGGKTAKQYRDNPEYVDSNFVVIKDCIFKSPSTAAQFVTGRSIDGYNAWKVEKKVTLGEYLKSNGLR